MNRDEVLRIRASEQDKRLAEELAASEQMTVSEYIRWLLRREYLLKQAHIEKISPDRIAA